ncbi:3-isopropylmalate dehydratase small subunit [Tropicimonas sp. S265A]|uniref:3-isopropylmalate dehydratase small subunit n=1 Tax=Tropicimonas sp. S265A TaxID=3415134 RepID=UPI003C7C66D0
MTGWTTHTGRAVALPQDGIDTDQIIPARFMSQPRAAGYGDFLLYDLRHDPAGKPRADFPLNAAPGASILVAGRNFGCGSSREAAVYALVDAGFRAVIAPSFGDIFSANAVNNGLAPIRLDSDAIETLRGATHDVTVNLQELRITVGNRQTAFDLDPVWQQKLIEGWDDIDMTKAWAGKIAAFRSADRAGRDWAWPRPVITE